MSSPTDTPESQAADAVLLVRPAAFGFNAEAATSNAFSFAPDDTEFASVAAAEFDGLERRLCDAGIEVLVLDDTPDPWKPDAVFPNNWLSTHADGTLVTYPMLTESRRLERRVDEVRELVRSAGFEVRRLVDLSEYEQSRRFLEGTGSLILDRPRRRAYASRSTRTDTEAIAAFDAQLGYATLLFDAHDAHGRPIYHTNVLMSLGTRFAVICLDAVAEQDRKRLVEDIESGGREVIDVGFDQLRSFACNILELKSRSGDPLIALSSAAAASFRPDQRRALERHGELLDVAIPTIERVGGGSVRCMIAEIHLPRGG